MKHYRLFAKGDINAFFGLMLDNMSDLVIMATILTGVFGMPRDLVLSRMLPGSAVGVLVGDLLYSWMAWRLATCTATTIMGNGFIITSLLWGRPLPMFSITNRANPPYTCCFAHCSQCAE